MLHLPGYYHKKESGQALLLILLLMSLVLTLILSSVSRSVTDIDISSYEDSSIRAFDAAQAGIEKTMIAGSDQSSSDLGNDASFVSRMTVVSEASNNYKYPLELFSGETATIFFVGHQKNTDGDYAMTCSTGECIIPPSLTVCWGESGTLVDIDAPAIYLEFFYDLSKAWQTGNFSGVSVATSSADPYSTRRLSNGFFAPTATGAYPCGKVENQFASRFTTTNIDYDNFTGPDVPNEAGQLLFVRITMLYNSSSPHPIWVNSTNKLPVQGSAIESVGSYNDVSRKLLLHRGFPEFPAEFANSIYSESAISK